MRISVRSLSSLPQDRTKQRRRLALSARPCATETSRGLASTFLTCFPFQQYPVQVELSLIARDGKLIVRQYFGSKRRAENPQPSLTARQPDCSRLSISPPRLHLLRHPMRPFLFFLFLSIALEPKTVTPDTTARVLNPYSALCLAEISPHLRLVPRLSTQSCPWGHDRPPL